MSKYLYVGNILENILISAVAFIIPVHMIDSQCHDNIICFSFMQFDLLSAKVSINNASGVKILSKYQLSPESSQ